MGCTNKDATDTIKTKEPFQVIRGEAEACPRKALEPPGNRIKGPADVPECDVCKG